MLGTPMALDGYPQYQGYELAILDEKTSNGEGVAVH